MRVEEVRRLNIPLTSWPSYDEEQIDAVASVLRTGQVNYLRGQAGRAFESEFSAWCGVRHSVAVANGTVALELCLKALRLHPGDEVIVTPRAFVAVASACVLNDLVPVFADVDIESGNITPGSVEAVITNRTRAIMPVHLGGWPCDMTGFMDLAERRGLKVIEDCAQAHGARIGGRSVGSFGHANAWSFCLDKMITTGGEGGMVTTDDEDLWSQMWSYKDHGKDYDAVYIKSHPPGYQWLHEGWGTNWRLTEPQSALGLVQLKRMPVWTAARAHNARIFRERFNRLSAVHVPWPSDEITHAWYRLYVHVKKDALKDGWSRDRIQAECMVRGLSLSVGSCSEIYRENCFGTSCLAPSVPLPNARAMTNLCLAFLVHPGLTDDMLHAVADVFEDVVIEATR